MSTALYIGRFQPFHLGHLDYIRHILKKHTKIIIIVGSTNKCDDKNPYGFEIRKRMISESLIEAGIKKSAFTIKYVPDYPGEDNRWYESIMQLVDDIDEVFTGENEHTRTIFKAHGHKVHSLNDRFRGISSTIVREKMKNDGKWDDLVPSAVSRTLNN